LVSINCLFMLLINQFMQHGHIVTVYLVHMIDQGYTALSI